MLTPKTGTRLTLALCIGLILAVLVAVTYFIPLYEEICTKNEYTGEKECGRYHLVTVALWHLFKILDAASVAITGLATVLLAYITYRLVSVAREQTRTMPIIPKVIAQMTSAPIRPVCRSLD
jgi:hypothetical protein